jgi:hypothetical protein
MEAFQMPVWRKSLLAVLLAVSVAAAADPVLLSHVPPDAKVFAGANLSHFLASPFGKTVIDQAKLSQPQIQQLVQAAGFDPFRDMQEFLIASTGTQKQDHGLVLIKGSFDPARLGALAQKSGAALTTYGGVQFLTGKKPTDAWFAFLDNATAAIGDAQSVKGVIDRRGSGGGPEARLRARIDQLSSSYDFWAISAAPMSDLAGGAMQGDILKAVVEMSGGIKFGADLLIAIEAVNRTDKDAAALADVVRFFVGMAQMSAQKNPNAANSSQLLQSLQLTAEGNVTRMSLSVPGAELEKLIRQARAAVPKGGLTIQSSPKDMGTVVVK